MNRRMIGSFALVAALFVGASRSFGAADDATITYQGSLTDGGAPANGVYDFQFRLFTGEFPFGFIAGSPISVEDVNVVDGLFTVKLNFGAAMNWNARWLDISVRPGASSGNYTILQPRQQMTAAPAAVNLALPYSVSYQHAASLFSIAQTGAGKGMDISTTGGGDAIYAHATGAGDAVNAYVNGTGVALYGQSTGGGTSIYGYNLGTSGYAGFFRTESSANAAHTLEVQGNGSGNAIHATSGSGTAGYFENTNSSNASTTLRSQTAGNGRALWAKSTGTATVAKIENTNFANNTPTLEVYNGGSGLAAKFSRGGVEVQGELHATIGTVLNRATPVGFGRFDTLGNLLNSSGNITVTYQNGLWKILVVGEGDPELWTITTTVSYFDADTNLEYVAKPSRPFSVAGQPGNGIYFIKDQCMNDCQEFQQPHYINFVIYKGV